MKHCRKIAEGINTKPALAELIAHPELWDSISLRRTANGSPHSQMTDIWVRYNDIRSYAESGDYSRINDPHIPIWYPAWKSLPALRPILFWLMAYVQGEMLGGVLLTRLPPGCGIHRHTDEGWHVEYYDKFYIPLQAEPGTRFCWDEGSIEPINGDVWWFDNTAPHWVENNSCAERIALIAAIHTDMFR